MRGRGYSIDDEGVREGVYCIGAPVFDAAGQAVAGIGVCIQKAMLGGGAEQRHHDAVTRVASQLCAAARRHAAPRAGREGIEMSAPTSSSRRAS